MAGVDLDEQILGRVTIRVVNGAGGDGYAIAKASLRRYQRIVVNFYFPNISFRNGPLKLRFEGSTQPIIARATTKGQTCRVKMKRKTRKTNFEGIISVFDF